MFGQPPTKRIGQLSGSFRSHSQNHRVRESESSNTYLGSELPFTFTKLANCFTVVFSNRNQTSRAAQWECTRALGSAGEQLHQRRAGIPHRGMGSHARRLRPAGCSSRHQARAVTASEPWPRGSLSAGRPFGDCLFRMLRPGKSPCSSTAFGPRAVVVSDCGCFARRRPLPVWSETSATADPTRKNIKHENDWT